MHVGMQCYFYIPNINADNARLGKPSEHYRKASFSLLKNSTDYLVKLLEDIRQVKILCLCSIAGSQAKHLLVHVVLELTTSR